MDVAAAGGGPILLVTKIITGSQEGISAQAAQRIEQAAKYLQIIEQLSSTTQQIGNAWQGGASEAAVTKITQTISAFEKIVKCMQVNAALLHLSGTWIASAQQGYNFGVSTTNPEVAALISNPWTYAAGSALATSVTASIGSWITLCEGVLHGLGSTSMLDQVMALTMIIQEIEMLAEGGGAGGSGGSSAKSKATALAQAGIGAYMASKAGTSAATTAPASSTWAGYPGDNSGVTSSAPDVTVA
jgi:uncharacterized protein YukE